MPEQSPDSTGDPTTPAFVSSLQAPGIWAQGGQWLLTLAAHWGHLDTAGDLVRGTLYLKDPVAPPPCCVEVQVFHRLMEER